MNKDFNNMFRKEKKKNQCLLMSANYNIMQVVYLFKHHIDKIKQCQLIIYFLDSFRRFLGLIFKKKKLLKDNKKNVICLLGLMK